MKLLRNLLLSVLLHLRSLRLRMRLCKRKTSRDNLDTASHLANTIGQSDIWTKTIGH